MVFVSIVLKVIKHEKEYHIPNQFLFLIISVSNKLFQINCFLYEFYKNNHLHFFNLYAIYNYYTIYSIDN